VSTTPVPDVELDEIDRRIVAALAEDGRLTNVELADRVGLSPPPCLRRVRRLEEAGVILGYRALVHPGVVGRGLTVFASLRMRFHDRELVGRIEALICDLPGVTEVHHLAGDADYLVRVEVADLAEYDHFTRDVITRLPGIGHVTSHVVLDTMLDLDRGVGVRPA
jgi:Lrp/AsnC family transcriptional regulator, leucine-responsive regulatory protein